MELVHEVVLDHNEETHGRVVDSVKVRRPKDLEEVRECMGLGEYEVNVLSDV